MYFIGFKKNSKRKCRNKKNANLKLMSFLGTSINCKLVFLTKKKKVIQDMLT